MTEEKYNRAVKIVREINKIKRLIVRLNDPDPIAEEFDIAPGDYEWYWKAKDDLISRAESEIEHLIIEFASL